MSRAGSLNSLVGKYLDMKSEKRHTDPHDKRLKQIYIYTYLHLHGIRR